jgi:hypothetical protein
MPWLLPSHVPLTRLPRVGLRRFARWSVPVMAAAWVLVSHQA